jgi:hypothetical protein
MVSCHYAANNRGGVKRTIAPEPNGEAPFFEIFVDPSDYALPAVVALDQPDWLLGVRPAIRTTFQALPVPCGPDSHSQNRMTDRPAACLE